MTKTIISFARLGARVAVVVQYLLEREKGEGHFHDACPEIYNRMLYIALRQYIGSLWQILINVLGEWSL